LDAHQEDLQGWLDAPSRREVGGTVDLARLRPIEIAADAYALASMPGSPSGRSDLAHYRTDGRDLAANATVTSMNCGRELRAVGYSNVRITQTKTTCAVWYLMPRESQEKGRI